MNAASLARYLDHTLLKPEATPADIASTCSVARTLGVKAVCVSPTYVALASRLLGETDEHHEPSGVLVATVVGFPSGAHHGSVKAMEAARAVTDGADEIDMVINLGAALDGNWDLVQAEIAEVRRAIGLTVLKVILESAALTPAQIREGCLAAERGGATYVKTSTGYHPAGGASLAAVAVMADTVGGRLGIKASGGIKTAADAQAFIDAGATRIGTSASADILLGARSGGTPSSY